MLEKRMFILIFMMFTLVVSVFASVDLIEEDIGDYKYISTRLSYWEHKVSGRDSPYPVDSEGNVEVSYPIYNLRYNDNEGRPIYVQVIEFTDNEFDKNYLSTWISDKIKENQSLFYNNNYLFKYYRSRNNLIWRYKNFYIQIGFNDDYSNLPNEIIEAYLEIYPSDCSENECPHSDIPIEEQIYKKFFLGYYEYTEGLFFKHNRFSIRCRNIVKYGREGATEYPDLDYNQFKAKINQYLSDSMYFSEDELKQLYDKCIREEEIEIEGLPLSSGFLKDCYDRVYLKLVEDNNEDRIGERSLKLCDNIDLIITKNNEYFEKLKEERGSEIINQIIDFIVQKELDKIELNKQYCKEFGIVSQENDGIIEENIYNCETDSVEVQPICHEQEDGRIICEEEEDESIVGLKPCTEEDLEKGLDCTPVKEVDYKEPTEEDIVQEKNQEEVGIEKQKETIFIRIISFFRSLFL